MTDDTAISYDNLSVFERKDSLIFNDGSEYIIDEINSYSFGAHLKTKGIFSFKILYYSDLQNLVDFKASFTELSKRTGKMWVHKEPKYFPKSYLYILDEDEISQTITYLWQDNHNKRTHGSLGVLHAQYIQVKAIHSGPQIGLML